MNTEQPTPSAASAEVIKSPGVGPTETCRPAARAAPSFRSPPSRQHRVPLMRARRPEPGTSPGKRPSGLDRYARLAVIVLLRLVIARGDTKALREVHDHRRIIWHNGELVSIAEYIYRLSETKAAREWSGRDPVVLDLALDNTIDKFSNLPDSRAPGSGRSCGSRGDGPDCRYYLRALVHRTQRISPKWYSMSRFEKDRAIARAFPSFAGRHFAWSCRDMYKRQHRLSTQFTIETENGKLTVYLPVEIPGAERAQWIRDHVGEVDPSRPCERERVQEIIDRTVARRRIVSLSVLEEEVGQFVAFEGRLPWSLEHGLSAKGLIETVALEKAANADRLRPALHTLPPARVLGLVETILTAMGNGRYHPARIAREFGLSKSCMTRFAGPNWLDGGNQALPDLFRNTAWVLARSPVFLAAADEAGVLPGVLEAIGRSGGKPC